MINFLKKWLGGNSTDFKKLINNGAQIIDVRTMAEFKNGHIASSINIPLQDLHSKINTLDPKRPIITVCASGARSFSAKNILNNQGFETYNGGGWKSFKKKIGK